MKLQRAKTRQDPENVIPLINVVFLLLIFFMLAGKLGQSDPFEIAPPQSASEEAPADRPVTVYMAPDGRIALGQETLGLDALETAMRARMEAGGGTAVRLKTDQATEANRVIDVMDALRRAGIERVTLLTVAQES